MNTCQELCVIAELTALEGNRDKLVELFKPLIEATRKEPGCLYYDCCEDRPGHFTFVEKYKTTEDLEFHMKTNHFLEAIKVVSTLIDGEVKISRLPKLI